MGPLATPLCSCLQELLGNKAGETEVECACEQVGCKRILLFFWRGGGCWHFNPIHIW